jgi:tetratricopeptide (TPR) repeat protein
VGLNENYTSRAGTGYHIQIEDRGPVFDDASETWVRRVNTIVYAHYGEPTARIIWGRDEDFRDVRTQEHNRFVEGRIKAAAAAAREQLEAREERQAARIKALLLHYHQSRGEEAKAEFEEANRLYPFVFARAWQELKKERALASPEPGVPPEPEIDETIYPLDPRERELVLEIERIREELEKDLAELKRSGAADDILLATCAKILYRAHESLTQRAETGSDFAARRLEMTKNSLVTTYRQVRARLTRQQEGSAP